MGALEEQIGGKHYKGMLLQPMEFSVKNGWDAAAHTALKYLSRFKKKNGYQDLEKAQHCLKLRAELMPFDNWQRRRSTLPISMAHYVEKNKYDGLHAVALFKLELYVLNNHELAYRDVMRAVEELIELEYPLGGGWP